MTYNEDVDQQIDDYSELFDLYIEHSRLPETYADDPISQYLASQLDIHKRNLPDNDYKEALRQNLLNFFRSILPTLLEFQQFHTAETKLLQEFFESDNDRRRQLWLKVKSWLTFYYTKEQFNTEGYEQLLNDADTPAERILNAMEENWKEASAAKLRRKQLSLLRGSGPNKQIFIGVGQNDYRQRKKISNTFYKYPILTEIVRQIGREHETDTEDVNMTVSINEPVLLRHANTRQEIDGTTVGNDLSSLLPYEYALIDEPVFYKRFANKEFQQYSSLPPIINKQKTFHTLLPEPRMEKGPIILAIDTSSSIEGKPAEIAKSLTLQTIEIVRKEKRKCFLIVFSVREQHIELSRPSQFRKVEQFFSTTFTGGTDGEQMFAEALKTLDTDNFTMADILIISDFHFSLPKPDTWKRIKEEQKKGTRFYGLSIGNGVGSYEYVLDKYWTI